MCRKLCLLTLALAVTHSAFGQSYTIKTFAGGLPQNTQSALRPVSGITIDAAGNVFLSLGDYSIVVRMERSGSLTLVAGNGTEGFSGDNGPATSAQLYHPRGIAVDASGSLYISDADNQRIRKVSNGVITTVAGNGTTGFSGDGGSAVSAQLANPYGVAVAPSGDLYIWDMSNHRIRKVSNGVMSTVAGNGTQGFSGDDGPATGAQFGSDFVDIAVDSSGNLYIADAYNHRVRKVSSGVITTVVGGGLMPGDTLPATGASLAYPFHVAVDSSGSLYISDYDFLNSPVNRIRKVANGVITTVAGGGTLFRDNIAATTALLPGLGPVAVNGTGDLYFADGYHGDLVRKVSSGVVSTVAGNGTWSYGGDGGSATSAQLYSPTDVALDAAGSLYIADYDNGLIRKVSRGLITTVLGTGINFDDNVPAAEAGLFNAGSVAVDAAGNLYFSETGTYRVRKVSNGVVRTVAGNGKPGFSGDDGPATSAQLYNPEGIAVDSSGSLYIADGFNNRVRKVTNGVITTVAGGGDIQTGDNVPATSAALLYPSRVALDAAGNVYIADQFSVRKLSNGLLSTVAATGPTIYLQPGGIAVDSFNNVFVSNRSDGRILRVSAGVTTTVAGGGTLFGENIPATSARLKPAGLAIDPSGNIFIADVGDDRVRVLTPAFGSKNSASYAANILAPDMIGFGEASGIAPHLAVSAADPWPMELDGVRIEITDSQGQKRTAPIYFVAPNSVGYLVPAGIAFGPATFTLTKASGATLSGSAVIGTVSPGLYTANSSGSGVAAGFAIHVTSAGSRSQDYLFDVATRNPVPVDLGPASDQVYLSLYGTGFRGYSGQVTARVGGLTVPVLGAAAVGGYQGEDVVNIGPLPRLLSGRGEVSVVLSFDDRVANTVTVTIR